MKPISIVLILLCSLCFSGCSDDDNTVFFYEQIPIEKIETPDTFTRGETANIVISYFRPTDCHSFHNFDYDISFNQRTVTVINVIIDDGDPCESLEKKDTVDITLPFLVGDKKSYVFRFWQGKDDEDRDQFLEIEIPVEE